jgi:cyclophilin family peptidyl-prolyl cis-trans isomerase
MPKTATFTTSVGTFKAQLYTEKMPITCGNFIDLANSGFYDGIHFHRCVPDFICQFGCPNAKNPKSSKCGCGNAPPNTTFQGCDNKPYKRTADGGIPDEVGADNQKITNDRATLALANTGAPQSGGSQFFINLRHNKFLDWFDKSSPSSHPVFGKVTEGFDIVEKISKVPTHNESPKEPIEMLSVRIS